MRIDKQDTGYTLRQSAFPAAAGGALLGMGLIFGALTALILPAAADVRELAAAGIAVSFMAIVAGLGIHQLVIHLGRRLVLDAEGVHLEGTLMKERFLPWSKVRDLGITHADGVSRQRNQRAHYFYVSPTRLGSDGHIRVIRRHNRALLLKVSRADIDDLYGRGMIDFCEKLANEGREEWDRVVPYSSLTLNRRT